jgi:hypothetical protein
MPGVSATTKVIGVRVPIALAAAWEASSRERGVTVSAHVLALAMRGAGLSPRPPVNTKSLLPATLPVLTEVPKRAVHLRGAAPPKRKGKP